MSTNRKVWHLRRLDLFASMTDEEVDHLAGLLDDCVIPVGTELLKDIEWERVYLPKSGTVRLYQSQADRQTTVALLAPGRLFGISSSFGNGESKLGAVTLTEARLCFTTWPKSIDVLPGHPNVILQVTRGWRSKHSGPRIGSSGSAYEARVPASPIC